MIMSHVARTFVTRHCDDLATAMHYARTDILGSLKASVVTDAVAAFTSEDKVVSGHLRQLDQGSAWTLVVSGQDYNYTEISDQEASLTIYNTEMPESAIVYVESNSIALIDIMAPANGRAPFYLSHCVRVQHIIQDVVEHPYWSEQCTALQFTLTL